MHISGFIGQTETSDIHTTTSLSRPLICNYTYPSVFSPIFCTSTGYYSWLKLALKWFPCKILLGCYGNERWKIHGAATIIPWPQQCESQWRLIIRNINEGGWQRSSQIVINLQLIVCEKGNNNGIWWDNGLVYSTQSLLVMRKQIQNIVLAFIISEVHLCLKRPDALWPIKGFVLFVV